MLVVMLAVPTFRSSYPLFLNQVLGLDFDILTLKVMPVNLLTEPYAG
jgi:hypothetical protein